MENYKFMQNLEVLQIWSFLIFLNSALNVLFLQFVSDALFLQVMFTRYEGRLVL